MTGSRLCRSVWYTTRHESASNGKAGRYKRDAYGWTEPPWHNPAAGMLALEHRAWMPVSKKEAKMAAIVQDLTYDAALAQLEAVLATLEGEDLPLEQALTLYEEGAALAAFCARKLEAAELRVQRWQPGDQTMPFEGWQEG